MIPPKQLSGLHCHIISYIFIYYTIKFFPLRFDGEPANYCLRHGLHIRENLRFLSTGMGFSKNFYASVLKAPSRNKPHVRFFCGFHYLREMLLNRSRWGENIVRRRPCYGHTVPITLTVHPLTNFLFC